LLDARRPEAAARLLIEPLGSAIGCVTNQRLTVSAGHIAPHEVYAIRLADRPNALRSPEGGPSGLRLDLEQHFIVDVHGEATRPVWHATTRMYQYRLLDHFDRELLVYHWQPSPDYLGPDHSHLPVSASLTAQTSAVDRQSIHLDKLHLATGRVSLASVVRMLITEFGIATRRHDRAEVLDHAERIFQEELGQPV
jgi:hypothetical protein